MAIRSVKTILCALSFVTGAALMQGCSINVAEKDDREGKNGADAKTDPSDGTTSKGSSISLTQPDGEKGEFDEIYVQVCSRDKSLFQKIAEGLGHPGWKEGDRDDGDFKWKKHKHHKHHGKKKQDEDEGFADGEWQGADGYDETVASQEVMPGEDGAGVLDEEYVDDEEYEEHDMGGGGLFEILPWPFPSPGEPFPGFCQVVTEYQGAYEPGKAISLDGVPIGLAIVNVELRRNGATIEAGWGKAIVSSKEAAKAIVAVHPVAGSLDIEVTRLGDEDPMPWECGIGPWACAASEPSQPEPTPVEPAVPPKPEPTATSTTPSTATSSTSKPSNSPVQSV